MDRIVPSAALRATATALGKPVLSIGPVGHAGYCEDPATYARIVLEALAAAR